MSDQPVLHLPIELGPITSRPFADADFDVFFRLPQSAGGGALCPVAGRDCDEAVNALRKRVAHYTIEAPGDVFSAAIMKTATGRLIGPMTSTAARARWALGCTRSSTAEALPRRPRPSKRPVRGGHDPARYAIEGILRETEYLKGEWCDEQVFAILARQWAGRCP